MAGITRFGMSIDSALIKKFDALIGKKGYGSRSAAIQDLVRDKLVEEEWEAGEWQGISLGRDRYLPPRRGPDRRVLGAERHAERAGAARREPVTCATVHERGRQQ